MTGWSEERLLRWIQESSDGGARLAGSRGHDAAVLARLPGRPVACVDQTIEHVHFAPGVPARLVGRKAVDRALSDLAATAARPWAVLLALSAPPETAEAWLRSLIASARARAAAFGAELVGGDLAASRGPVGATVTALGVLAGQRRAPGRDRARPGQVVLLSGPVGGSRLGRHLAIEPRVELGRWLHERGATALMDVSDGLALDLARLARASGVRIDLERVPVHADARRAARASSRTALEHALHDGEDHELLATLPAARAAALLAEARRRFRGLSAVGRVRRGRGLWLPAREGGEPVRWHGAGGYRHGA